MNMKKSEIVQELPKCDTEIMKGGKATAKMSTKSLAWCRIATNLQFVEEHALSSKCNKACIILFQKWLSLLPLFWLWLEKVIRKYADTMNIIKLTLLRKCISGMDIYLNFSVLSSIYNNPISENPCAVCYFFKY